MCYFECINFIFNIYIFTIVAKTSFSIARYTGVLTNPAVWFYLNVFIMLYMHISFIRRFLLKRYIRERLKLSSFQYQFEGMGMSWFAILMTQK